MHEMGLGPADISFLLGIPKESIKYVIYRKHKLYPPKRAPVKLYIPKWWK